jgi:hypothetical protein
MVVRGRLSSVRAKVEPQFAHNSLDGWPLIILRKETDHWTRLLAQKRTHTLPGEGTWQAGNSLTPLNLMKKVSPRFIVSPRRRAKAGGLMHPPRCPYCPVRDCRPPVPVPAATGFSRPAPGIIARRRQCGGGVALTAATAQMVGAIVVTGVQEPTGRGYTVVAVSVITNSYALPSSAEAYNP